MLRGSEVDTREMTVCCLTQIGKDLTEKVHLRDGRDSLILLRALYTGPECLVGISPRRSLSLFEFLFPQQH